MGYGLCAAGGPAIRTSICKRFVVPISIEDLEMMALNYPSSKETSPSLASCGMSESSKTSDCLALLCSG